jgi:hypothetical protein
LVDKLHFEVLILKAGGDGEGISLFL